MQYTRIPQSYFDVLPQLSGTEAKILAVVYRCTLGWNKTSAIISLSVMAKHTGSTIRQLSDSIKRIRELGLVSITQTAKGMLYTIVEETAIENNSIEEIAIEETSTKVLKKFPIYKEKKESTTTSDDVVRKRVRKPKQLPLADAVPERTALTIFRAIHRLNTPIALRDTVTTCVTDLDRWESICTEWIGKGFRPGNVSGCLEVYKNGWKKHGTPIRQRQRGDVQEQRRNERMAQTIAEYDRQDTA